MPTHPKVPVSPSLLSLEPDWVREMRAENKKPTTIDTYLKRFNNFLAWLSPDGNAVHCPATLADMDRPTITGFFEWLYGHAAPNTVLSHHIALRVFFAFCIDYGDLEEGHNPLRWIDRPKPEIVPPPILTDDQIRQLLATCEHGKSFKDRRDYALMRVFLATGMRIQEMTGLELRDVYLDEGIIHVEHAKGGRPRTVAIGVRTVRALGQYIHVRARHNQADVPALWIGQRGAMAYHTIYCMIVDRAAAAGIEGMHPHLFRHHLAHNFLASGGQESSLLQLAGWRDSKMLRERYGAALASERAVAEHHRLNIGEKW